MIESENTYNVFDNTSGTSLLNEGARFKELSSVLLKVLLWVSLGNTEALELTNNSDLNWFVLDDDVAWCLILLSSSSALNDGSAFSLGSVWDPSFDDDVT